MSDEITTVRVDLIAFDSRAYYRSHLPGDDPLMEHVDVSIDRDRFNAMGKPGYLDVSITAVDGRNTNAQGGSK